MTYQKAAMKTYTPCFKLAFNLAVSFPVQTQNLQFDLVCN